jgi:hypothetical protein
MTDRTAEHAIAAAIAAAKAVVDDAKRLGLTWTIRPATVKEGVTPSLCLAVYDGDTTTMPMTSLLGSLPTGARVYALAVPPAGNYIIGMAGEDLVALPNADSVNGTGTGTTVSATFVTIASIATMSFVKRSDTSRLMLSMNAEWFSTAVTTEAAFGLQVGATDYQIMTSFQNAANIVEFSGGVTHTPVIPAGIYTVSARWRRVSGAGTLTVGSAETLSYAVMETV